MLEIEQQRDGTRSGRAHSSSVPHLTMPWGRSVATSSVQTCSGGRVLGQLAMEFQLGEAAPAADAGADVLTLFAVASDPGCVHLIPLII